MRTSEQGQAAVPGEREDRRRLTACLGGETWAMREYPMDCHSFCGALSVCPPAYQGGAGFAVGAPMPAAFLRI